jgi:hypothetical protein
MLYYLSNTIRAIRLRMHTKNLKGREHLIDLGVNARMILK